MGRGIAALCAVSGFETAVFESDEGARGRVREAIESSWRRAAARGKLSGEMTAAAGGRLRILDRLEETDVNSLTPLQALSLLDELKTEIKAGATKA